MKDNHTPGPTIHRFIYYSPKQRVDKKFVQLGDYQRQSDLLGECLGALEDALGTIDSIRTDLALWMDIGFGKTNQECIRSLLYTMENTNEAITRAEAILAKTKGEL